MPTTSQRGFIVRPTLSNLEPEFEGLNIPIGSPIGSMYYSNTRNEDVTTSEGFVPAPDYPSLTERIKDKMLEKIESFLESDQLNELSVLVTTYQKFKELHP